MSKTDYFETGENPFLINIEDKQEYTIDDYINIQEKLDKKDLNLFFESLYPEGEIRTTLDEMKRRCTKGIKGKVIDISNPVLPIKRIFTVGNGGDRKKCFVCCTALLDNRCDASQTILQSLEEVGFNGHFLLLNGGFPNPTGTELKYCGIPYNFKIYMILEAKKLGFEKVIWIDAACYALNNPECLFELLDDGCDTVFRAFPPNFFEPNTYKNICFPKTIELMSKLVDRDVKDDTTVNSIVFGLNLKSEKVLKMIEEYYEMVKVGLPFLSAFPEELVFSCIMNKPEYKYVFSNKNSMYKLYINEIYLNKEDAKNHGYYFLQRKY